MEPLSVAAGPLWEENLTDMPPSAASSKNNIPGTKPPSETTLDWQAEQWWPFTIRPADFYRGPSCFHFQKIDSDRHGLPMLLLNWEMFLCLWRVSWRVRELQAKSTEVEQEKQRISNLLQSIRDDISHRQYEIELIERIVPRYPQRHITSIPLGVELFAEKQEHEKEIEHNETRCNQLVAEYQRAENSYRVLLEQSQEDQGQLQIHLDNLFGEMGVLPNAEDLNEAVRVPVLWSELGEGDNNSLLWSENNWNDGCDPAPVVSKSHSCSIDREDPEATWNNTWPDYPQEDPIRLLSQEREQQRQEGLQAQAEFERFRGSYNLELARYIHQARSFGRDDTESVFENEFGARWVTKFQLRTLKYKKAEEEFLTTEEKIMDLKCADKLLAQPNSGSELVKIHDANEVEQFGQMLPSRKRKRIDDWLDTESTKTKQQKTQSVQDADSTWDISEQSDVSKVEYADGYARRLIDRHNRQAREAWPIPHDPYANYGVPEQLQSEFECMLELEAASVD
jgi:hypothetical protein